MSNKNPRVSAKDKNAGPIPKWTKDMEPNIVKAGVLIQAMNAMQELSQMRPVSSIAVHVFLAFDELQKLRNHIVNAFNGAPDMTDKQAILDTEVELPFQPFNIEGFVGDALSTSSYAVLKGWLVTSTAKSTVKLPVFGKSN